MTVEDIEKAIAKLAPDELAKLPAWFEAFEAERFDRKIEHDAKAGRLDRLADEALAEFSPRPVRHFASAQLIG